MEQVCNGARERMVSNFEVTLDWVEGFFKMEHRPTGTIRGSSAKLVLCKSKKTFKREAGEQARRASRRDSPNWTLLIDPPLRKIFPN